MEARPEKCPSCHAPVQPGAPFCGQCGFDLPAIEPGARPRPEKCSFCAAPVEGWELACQQCGFDLDSDWQPASEDEEKAVFNPAHRACTVCGELNRLTADFCKKCNAPVGNYTSMKPFEKLFAEGFLYRRAIEGGLCLPLVARVSRALLGCAFLGSAAVFLWALVDEGLALLMRLPDVVVVDQVMVNLLPPIFLLLMTPLYGYVGFRLLFPRQRAKTCDDATQPRADAA